jgi:hypothetical protein
MAHMMLAEKRASRGQRMGSLVGKALEDDEAFWNNEVWNDGSDDESFHTQDEEAKPDVFDSDFDESETEDEEEEDKEEERRASKSEKRPAASNRYADPANRKMKVVQPINRVNGLENTEENGEESKQKPSKSTHLQKKESKEDKMEVDSEEDEEEEDDNQSEPKMRTLRDSTKSKTIYADVERQKKEDELRSRPKPLPQPKQTKFDYMEMLKGALETEVLFVYSFPPII